MLSEYACFTLVPKIHPWRPDITDLACGYLEKADDVHCQHCHRNRPENPEEQL
jgi:hypothetical protein